MADFANRPLLFVDVETTGLSHQDKIVSLGAIAVEDPTSMQNNSFDVDATYLIFNPGIPSNPRATRVHGFSDTELSLQDSFSDYAEELSDWFDGHRMVVAHNANFDERFIRNAFGDAGVRMPDESFFCTMLDYRRQYEGSAALKVVLKEMGIRRVGKIHGALEDAWLALQVFCWLRNWPVPEASDKIFIPPINYRSTKTRSTTPGDADINHRLFETHAPKNLAVRKSIPTPLSNGDDSPDMTQMAQYNHRPVAQEITIVYRDSNDNVSTRTIAIDQISPSGPTTFISAFCYLRNKSRTFIFEQIVEAYDANGEAIGDLHWFFQSAFGVALDRTHAIDGDFDAWAKTLSCVEAEAVLLKMLAASDGEIGEGELEAVEGELLAAYAIDGITAQKHAALKGLIRRVTTSPTGIRPAIDVVRAMPNAEIVRFIDSCTYIIRIDGKVHQAEVGMLREFARGLGLNA